MQHVFENDNAIPIKATTPTEVISEIVVPDDLGLTKRVVISLELLHTYTGDLEISVEHNGTGVVLVRGRGGSGNHFIDTTFDDSSPTPITDGAPPFIGVFAPEQKLSALAGGSAGGKWTLRVKDRQFLDGGSLNRWQLKLAMEPKQTSDFLIDVHFLGGLTSSQQDVFAEAAKRWSEAIVGDLPAVRIGSEEIDDVLIDARGVTIDGGGGVLGRAGPTHIRPGSRLPARGVMEFDVGDLARMEADGSLVDVIVHEMGHVLGIGTLWDVHDLLIGAGSPNPRFTGLAAMLQWGQLLAQVNGGPPVPTPVPVANTGGPGTRDGHWRESVLGSELMTGFLDVGNNPLSRVTVASLADLGYAVDMEAAAPFALLISLQRFMLGIGAGGGYGKQECAMCGAHPEPVELPESALV